MKNIRIHIFILFVFPILGGVIVGKAQQIPSYTQFVLNQYALNPAYSGTNLGIEVIAGSRIQWVGFDHAPVTNFASVTFGWREDFSYKGKHGLGAYVEDDRIGAFSSKAAYASYSYHIKIFTGLNVATGISAGVRQLGITSDMYDVNDPALNFQKSYFTMYPDVIPGMRFYTKKLFIDVSIRQLYKNKMQQGSKHFGSKGASLDPTLIAVIKRKFYLGNNTWMVVPAAKVQTTHKIIPMTEGNLMVFYAHRIGAGVSLRGFAFASAIVQVKITKNIVAGFSYDYTLGKLRAVSANSFELLFALTPGNSGDERNLPKRNVANCPDFDF